MKLDSTIRAVFFDAVGTLIFPSPSAPEMYARVAQEFGVELPAAEVRRRFLLAFREQEAHDRQADWLTSEEREIARWRQIVATTLPEANNPDACFERLYRHYARPDAWRVADEAASLFDTCQARGLILGLASNYDRRLYEVIAGHPQLRQLEPHIVISSVIGHRKPARDFFSVVRQAVPHLRADEIAFVGDDWENDYLGATTAGMRGIFLDPHDRQPEAAHRIRSLGDLV